MSRLPKVMILPIEIFQREIDGRLLHALIALREGWSVILGSKLEINRNIWRLPRGVYLFSTLSQKRVTMARMLKKIGFASQGWDEEGLVYLNRDLYLARRVSSQTLANIDQVFAWGEVSRQDLEIKARSVSRSVLALGNPRLDLLRPQLRSIHERESRHIRERFGNFVLLNTNFPSVNFIQQGVNVRSKKMEGGNTRAAAELYERLLRHRQVMFNAFLHAAPEIAKALAPRYHLVVRPHPAENAETWRRALRECPNATVISEGAVIPWLLAAGALLHNDCTTAVEARLLGREPIAFVPPEMPGNGATFLPNAISHQASSVEELCDMLRAALEASLGMTAEQKTCLHRYISGIDGPLAAERAVSMAEKLLLQRPHVPFASQAATRMFGAARHAWKLMTPRGRRSSQYISKVFPGDWLKQVTERLSELAPLLGLQPEIIAMRPLYGRILALGRKDA